jgi:dCMP deaminase
MRLELHEAAMETAKIWAKRSKDPSTQVGCCILGPDNEVRSVGYNGFPRGMNDDLEERYKRPLKYKYTEHAERNAMYNALRMGLGLKDCVLYTTMSPCCDCARGIIQTGIKKVIIASELVPNRWFEDFKLAAQMLREVEIEFLNTNLEPAELKPSES